MRVSIDTDADGAAELVAAIARVNIRDALRSSAVKRALLLRAVQRPDLLRYADDASTSPFSTDEWAAWTVLAERYGAIQRDAKTGLWIDGDPEAIVWDDCEGMTAIHGAAMVLCAVPFEVYACITHPKNSTTAHAFNRIGKRPKWRVFDGSVRGGMREPRSGWYDQADTSSILIEPLNSGRYDT